MLPTVLRFRDVGKLRPIAPFSSVGGGDLRRGRSPWIPYAGNSVDVLLTRALLESAGDRLEEVVFSVRVANRKAARRTGDEANAFEASIEVRGDDFACRPLLTANPLSREASRWYGLSIPYR